MGVRLRVCPLFQCRLNKSFGLAVGLWPVGSGSFMSDTKLSACFTKFTGFVAGSIIRQYPLDPHTALRIPGDGKPEELHGRFRCLIRQDRRAGHPRGVINANMQIFPAGLLWHPRSNASAAGRKFLHRPLPSSCSGNARGGSFYPQALRRPPGGNDFSIF